MMNMERLQINCETCRNDCKDNKECVTNEHYWWTPKSREICIGCHYTHGNNEGKCCRHAECCLLNYKANLLEHYNELCST